MLRIQSLKSVERVERERASSVLLSSLYPILEVTKTQAGRATLVKELENPQATFMCKQSSLKQTVLEESHFETPVLGFEATGASEESGLRLTFFLFTCLFTPWFFWGLLKMKANKTRFGASLREG